MHMKTEHNMRRFLLLNLWWVLDLYKQTQESMALWSLSKCHTGWLTVPAGQWGAGQARSVVAITQCSVNTTSLEQAFNAGGDAIFCAFTLCSLWHFSTVGADCSNCFLIFYQFSSVMQALGFLKSTSASHWLTLIIQAKTSWIGNVVP